MITYLESCIHLIVQIKLKINQREIDFNYDVNRITIFNYDKKEQIKGNMKNVNNEAEKGKIRVL